HSPWRQKRLAPLFHLRRLPGWLFGCFLLGFCLLDFFLWRRFLFGRFLFRGWPGCGPWCGSLLFRLLAYDCEFLFLSLHDLLRLAAQLLVVFQPRQLVVVFEAFFLEIHAVLPWGNLIAPSLHGPVICCFGRSS